MTNDDKKALQARLKHRIDKWLELIPDEPTAGRLQRAASKNTLQSQLALPGRDVARKWRLGRMSGYIWCHMSATPAATAVEADGARPATPGRVKCASSVRALLLLTCDIG